VLYRLEIDKLDGAFRERRHPGRRVNSYVGFGLEAFFAAPEKPRVRYIILIIIANIRNKARFRSRDPLRRNSEWDIRRNAVPKSQTDIAMLIRRNGECWL
jgi:hypothetical protein